MEHNIPWQIFLLFFTFYVFNDLITIRTTTTTIKGRLAVGISKAEANRSMVEMKQKPVTLAGLLCGTASQFTGQPRCTRKRWGAARAQSHDTMITLLLVVKLQLFDAWQPARLLSRLIILLIFFIFAFSDPFYLLQVLLQLLFNPLYKKYIGNAVSAAAGERKLLSTVLKICIIKSTSNVFSAAQFNSNSGAGRLTNKLTYSQ